MSGNYFQRLWRAIRPRGADTDIYKGSIENDKGWSSSDESLPPPPRPPLPFVRMCDPPIEGAAIAPIVPRRDGLALIYLRSDVIAKARFTFMAISGQYDAGSIHLLAVNRLREIQKTESKSNGVAQEICIEPPTATLEDIIDASSKSVILARDASDQLETTQGVVTRCRYDAILLHGKRVRYVIEGEKGYQGQLYYELHHFTIQEGGKKRLSFYFDDARFASGKCYFEPLEE